MVARASVIFLSYRVGPQFPFTFLFYLEQDFFLKKWYECIAQSKLFFGAKTRQTVSVIVEML